MENTGEVMTSTIVTPIQQTAEIAGETLGSALEPVVESADNASFAEIPIEGLPEERDDIFGFDEVLNEEYDSTELSDEEKIEDAREELEEITEVEEPEPEKDNGYDEQLATLNETIRLLEIQRDALKKQLNEGLFSLLGNILKFIITDSLSEKPADPNMMEQDSKNLAWKEGVRGQLREIEQQLAILKAYRKSLVANN